MVGDQLGQRLRAVSSALDNDADGADRSVAHLVRAVAASGRDDRVWLLLTAVLGAFPSPEEFLAARRQVEIQPAEDVADWLVECAARSEGSDHLLALAVDQVVAECDYSARVNHHSGIQRVVRSTMSRWHGSRPVVPVAWAGPTLAFRELDADETTRLTRWTGRDEAPADDAPPISGPITILVPWRSTVILLDMPQRAAHPRLAALAQYSGNSVSAVGYDCIPVVSGDMVPPALPEDFVHYLSAIKHCDRVAGISASATTEFAGFAEMVQSQGLPGPSVVECQLPVDGLGHHESPARPAYDIAVLDQDIPGPSADEVARRIGSRPVVLCIGSFEPRKNQTAVLSAAETLWSRGVDFELRLIGPGGWKREIREEVQRLHRAGHAISILTAISEHELAANYRDARCTIFVSLHEGYGLPVAESIAHGVPVVTTKYGSTAEIASSGGCVLVDPRDDYEIADALGRVLTDRTLAAELEAQIAARNDRGWGEYADELWATLVDDLAPKGDRR